MLIETRKKKLDWKKNMLAQYCYDLRLMASGYWWWLMKYELLQMVDANDMENYDIFEMAQKTKEKYFFVLTKYVNAFDSQRKRILTNLM